MKTTAMALILVAAALAPACGSKATTETTPSGRQMMSGDDTSAGDTPMVGGAPMYANKDIVDNAVNSKDHTTLVSAVKAADLVGTLKGPGPFTVFAPTNAAFDKVPKEALESLLKPENKQALTGILTYHVVAGNLDSKAIAAAIQDGGGTATLSTVAGGSLSAAMEGSELVLTDAKGGKSKVTIADVRQSNGVIHVVDTVLMPK